MTGTNKARAALVIGTRPEAIKMAPVYRALLASEAFEPLLISTGQHKELLLATLSALAIESDIDLSVMNEDQTPNQVASKVIDRLDMVLTGTAPSIVLVQGDTTTVLAASIAAFHRKIHVGHIEAGLRTYDLTNPFPEEANRQLVDRLATWCFAPTVKSADNLLKEGICRERVYVTGNTGVDSLLWATSHTQHALNGDTVLLTLHRRESFGPAMLAVLEGVRRFLEVIPDARILWPVHPNPNVISASQQVLGDHPRVVRVSPMDYLSFAGALATCRFVITDSGGIQEEAPSLGKIVVIARETTERPEAVTEGLNRIAGRSATGICDASVAAWESPPYQGTLPVPNPYGDGHAGQRIAAILEAACK